jgi:hypothetical protein
VRSNTPYTQGRVSSWRSVVGISHGLTVPMTNHTDPIQLLTIELDTLSATSLGRHLLRRIESTGLDTLGATTPSELAEAIEWNPRTESSCHPTLTALVPVARRDNEIAIIVMGALRLPLRDMWYSIVRFGADPDVGTELLGSLWRALADSGEETNVERILESALAQTRRTIRMEQRRLAVLDSLDGVDLADTAQIQSSFNDDLLSILTREGVVSQEDAELIRRTRVDGVAFLDHVRHHGIEYKVTHQRRLRAERRIAAYLIKNPRHR